MVAIMYFGEMAIAILLAIFLLAISKNGIVISVPFFFGGVVAWTFSEYIFHRFVLHDLISVGHRLHHAQPEKPVLAILWQIWGSFALVYLIANGAFLAGSLVTYAWYLFVHHSAHHSPRYVPDPLLKHHISHHKFATRNYGVSTTVWDHVFGTTLVPFREKRNSDLRY
jgi:sterol desaturase/sphingolipid hydroxylase (fatty acid hydroxylase superfamily)